MKTLLLIPSVVKTDMAEAVASGRHPLMDYDALAQALRAQPNGKVDVLDYAAAERDTTPAVRLARKMGGLDAALAMMGFLRRKQYDAVFSNGENVGIPLALLFHAVPRRPGHVCIGHRLSAGKKRPFFTVLKAHRGMDTVFVYAQAQRDFAEDRLGIPFEKLALIAFHADERFYRPCGNVSVLPQQICAAGLEWRDYPTLIDAVAPLSQLSVKLAAASPWSKHENETEKRELPAHVQARRYEYGELRELYAQSSFVVVPLRETDFQAGITTILEAMAMGKAVITTRTTGQTDVIVEGETGLTVPPGDVSGWRRAIMLLSQDHALRERLGRNARRWLEENATLDHWTVCMINALRASASLPSIPDAAAADEAEPRKTANGFS